MKTGVEPQRSGEVKPSSNLAQAKQISWNRIGVTWRCERDLGVTCAVLSSESQGALYTADAQAATCRDSYPLSQGWLDREHQEISRALHCKPRPSSLLQKKGAIQILRVISN